MAGYHTKKKRFFTQQKKYYFVEDNGTTNKKTNVAWSSQGAWILHNRINGMMNVDYSLETVVVICDWLKSWIDSVYCSRFVHCTTCRKNVFLLTFLRFIADWTSLGLWTCKLYLLKNTSLRCLASLWVSSWRRRWLWRWGYCWCSSVCS